jgi:hypothetical protein
MSDIKKVDHTSVVRFDGPFGTISRTRDQVQRAIETMNDRHSKGKIKTPTEGISKEEFRALMREKSAAWQAEHLSKAPSLRGADGVAPPNTRQPNPPNVPASASNDEDSWMKLAAAEPDDAPVWSPLGFALRLDGRTLLLFGHGDSGNRIIVREDTLDPGWIGVKLGRFPFYFEPFEDDAAWVGIVGLQMKFLMSLADRCINEDDQKIFDAEPLC